jgi:hypothetical protein
MSTTNTEDAMRWGPPPPDRRRWQQVADAAETVTNDQAQAEKIATAVMASAFAPDVSPGDVISAEPDGTIVLDDGITTWNPARACEFLLAQQRRELVDRQHVWKLRQAVGRWWRIKVEQDNMDTSYLRSALGDKYYGTVMQIAADIEHSSLLQRLLAGEEPEDR